MVITIARKEDFEYAYTPLRGCPSSCIGHLRGYFDSDNRLYTTWEDNNAALKTQAFHNEFNDFMDKMRKPNMPLNSLGNMCRFCLRYAPEMPKQDNGVFIFHAESDDYDYFLRMTPDRGQYNLYIYAYVKPNNKEEATNGTAGTDA